MNVTQHNLCPRERSSSSPAATDPITLEIIKAQLVAIPNQIERNIERTAFSPLVYEYKDFAVGLVDPAGRLVAQSRGSLPIFVANALGTAVREGLSILGAENIHDGDVVISNSAAWMGQHLNNVIAYSPIRVEGGLIGFFAVLVHWVDIGGSVPGSCLSSSTVDVWQEGIQLPTLKLIERGMRRSEIFRLIETNTRFPHLLMGDIEAQLGGCEAGRTMMEAIIARYGVAAVREAISIIWRDSEASVETVLRRAPQGRYHASSILDNDGVRLDVQVPVDVDVEIRDGRLTVDFSRLSRQVVGPFNAGRNGGAIAAARIACKYLLAPSTPVNEGDFARLHVEVPEGTFLSAGRGAAIAQSGSMVPTVVDTIMLALGDAFPDRAAAAHHGIYGVHSFYGHNPRSGELFQHLDTVSGGWGATAAADGPGPFRSNGHGDVPDVPVEMQEVFYPYRLIAKRLRPDSGGPGRNRGGLGVEKVYAIAHPCKMIVAFDRTLCPPWGIAGGESGQPAGVEIVRANGEREALTKGERSLGVGDSVHVMSGGGGGYGPAYERKPDAVVNDVRLGYVSAEAAAERYGVVLDAGGAFNSSATEKRRAEMRAARRIGIAHEACDF
ncbi:MAG: hydantoinase B/oxoprolinase family protein [Bradyrhizobiaceae bacterium]|nr:hydantoinase B/oxoprolinase family protein [Bradyrhizobiaceae bacterium]